MSNTESAPIIDTNTPAPLNRGLETRETLLPTDLYNKTCVECKAKFSCSHAGKIYCDTCAEARAKAFSKEYKKRSRAQSRMVQKLESKLGSELPHAPTEGWERGILDDLANPFINLTIPELCAKWGISPKQYYDLRENLKDFDEVVAELTERYKLQLPAFFLKALIEKAKRGSDTAIKMGLEITNQYAPKAPTPAPKSQFEGMSEDDKDRRLAQLLKKVKS